MGIQRGKRYCAFCGTQHMVYYKRHLNHWDISVAAVLTFFLTWLFWQRMDPKGIAFFVIFIGFAEIFVQIRRRLSLVCQECGFDPVSYLRDRERCVDKVKATLAARQTHPLAALKPLAIPYRQQNSLPVIAKPSNLSTSVRK